MMSQDLPEIQQIPARHGTATFVPKGHVIKIINTYGRQVVDTWAFALPKPPSQEELDEENEREHEGHEAAEQVAKGEEPKAEGARKRKAGAEAGKQPRGGKKKASDRDENTDGRVGKADGNDGDADGVEADDNSEPRGWSSYIPSMSRVKSRGPKEPVPKEEQTQVPKDGEKSSLTWAQHLSATISRKEDKSESNAGDERTWASYFPSGKSFSNYLPQNASSSLSAFASSHYRDTTKSYAEQLYDFSKTPVGAGALSG